MSERDSRVDTPERILVVRLAGIGDVVMASTVVSRIRAEQPGARITWLCGDVAGPIVRLFDGVDDVITVNEHDVYRGGPLRRARTLLALWTRLIAGRFDRAIVLHVDKRYRVLVAPLVRAKKVFLSRAKHGEMIPVPGRFLGDEYARLVGSTAHVGPIERRYAIADARHRFPRAVRTDDRKRVILVPGGARNVLRENAQRRWPVEWYAAVAAALIADGCDVVLVGNAQDAWVRPVFDGLRVVDRIGSLDLPQTVAQMADSDLVISHDTGPAHLARLVRAPLVALFGPTEPGQMLSMDETVTVLWGGEHLACRPCYDGREFASCSDNRCMKDITPSRVIAVAREILARAAHESTCSLET